MMADIFLPGLLLGCVILYGIDSKQVEATMCSPVTEFHCPVSLFSNGTCLANGQCACTDGYSANVYGCQEDLVRPYVRMTDNEALPVGTGILALMSMTCQPADSGGTYTWRRDGVVIGESGATMITSVMRTAPVETLRYSCQYSVDGRDSPESDAFELTVFAQVEDIDPDAIRFQPAVQGVPTSVVDGVQLTLACVNYIYHQVQRVEWSLPNGDYNGMQMTLTVTKGRDNTNVSCTIVYSKDVPIKSPEVRIPKMSDNIPSVVIKEGDRYVMSGQNVSLTCGFVEDDFVTKGISITWGWSHQGVPIPTLITNSITIQTAHDVHAGQWRCSAIYGSRVKRESPAINVYVDVPINITAIATPPRTVEDGITEVKCQAYSPISANFSYSWKLNQEELLGYVDDTIYLNFADDSSSTLSGDYICTVTVDQTIAVSDTVTVPAPIRFSDSPAPTLQVEGNPQEFLYGDTYHLDCLYSKDYTLPGIQLEYFWKGNQLANATVLMNDTGHQVLTCRAVFNGLETRDSKAIGVVVEGGPNPTETDAIPETQNETISLPDTETQNETTSSPATQVTTTNSSSNSTSLLRIEAFDNATDVTSPINSTDLPVSKDLMASPIPNTNRNPDPKSTVTRTSVKAILPSLGQQPTLSILGHSENSSLLFNKVYQLKCQLFYDNGHDGVSYEFRQGDMVVQRSDSDVYTIINDVVDKVYSCRVVFSNVSSPMSEAIVVSFEVFKSVWITWKESDVTTCSATVTLECDIILIPGVPGPVNYTWFDKDMDIIDKSHPLTFSVTHGFVSTFYCQAEVGHHFKMATLSIVVRGTDKHCAGCCLSVSWTLLVIATTFIVSLH